MRASYEYNELGEILAVVDAKGNRITSDYDLVGARTLLSSPDTGTVLFSYDEAGNLVEKTDEVLRSRGETIRYSYDGLERLVRTSYPRTAPTVYVYGDENASQGLVGRLIRREDSSGSVSYEYGLLGETTAMTRIIERLTPLADDESARFEYRSDYLGRMQSITYPDGEVVNYDYDSGGQVKSVTSEHNGLTTTYVADIAYDEFGQRTYIEYGNGTRTSYRYDENRRWLAGLRTTTQFGTVYQDMQYRFDLVGNVLGYTNESGSYKTEQNYQYDDLYQLVYATGESVYHPYSLTEYTSTYTQSFSYDELGNMTSKVSSSATRPSRVLGDNLNYSYTYSYYATKAHQAERIGTRYYRYDENGNVIEEREGGHGSGTVLGGTVSAQGDLRITDRGFGLDRTQSGGSDSEVYCRTYVWNEENKLIRSVDNQIAVDYRYDATGERTVKYSVQGESLYFDPQWVCQTDGQNLRQLKNIYVGETRIATRLSIKGDGSTKYEQVNTYYYHADHLGSAQLISDYEGKEYERIEYTPYGESWIEKASDGLAKLPYRFTGKERDSETGLYYYGARYLNPTTGLWLSTDPALAEYLPVAPVDDEARKHNEKLPGMGGAYNLVNLVLYHYAGNNPVRYTDPDGEYLHIVVSKGEHTVTVHWSVPTMGGSLIYGSYTLKDNIVTNVNKNPNGTTTQQFADSMSNASSDNNRTQKSSGGFTNPTQVKNGIYRISGTATPSSGSGNVAPDYKYGEGDLGFSLDVTQLLPDTKNPKIMRLDIGYMFHITPYWFTNGCVGFHYNAGDSSSREEAESQLKKLVDLYKTTMGKYGDKNVTVEFRD